MGSRPPSSVRLSSKSPDHTRAQDLGSEQGRLVLEQEFLLRLLCSHFLLASRSRGPLSLNILCIFKLQPEEGESQALLTIQDRPSLSPQHVLHNYRKDEMEKEPGSPHALSVLLPSLLTF